VTPVRQEFLQMRFLVDSLQKFNDLAIAYYLLPLPIANSSVPSLAKKLSLGKPDK